MHKYDSVAEQEEKFQEAMAEWVATGSREAWNQMFLRVTECCRALALKIAPGKSLVEERSLDAACKVMKRIRDINARPAKLSSYCYWPVREAIQGPRVVAEDKELQLDEKHENQTQDKNMVLGILRKELMCTKD